MEWRIDMESGYGSLEKRIGHRKAANKEGERQDQQHQPPDPRQQQPKKALEHPGHSRDEYTRPDLLVVVVVVVIRRRWPSGLSAARPHRAPLWVGQWPGCWTGQRVLTPAGRGRVGPGGRG